MYGYNCTRKKIERMKKEMNFLYNTARRPLISLQGCGYEFSSWRDPGKFKDTREFGLPSFYRGFWSPYQSFLRRSEVN